MLIFLFGEDTYRSRKNLRAIKEKFLKSQKGVFNFSYFESLEVTSEILKKIFSWQQLFARKKLTIIANPFSLDKNLLAKISGLADKIEKDKYNTLVLWEGKIIEKNLNQPAKEFFRKLKKIKYAQEFPLLKPWQLICIL